MLFLKTKRRSVQHSLAASEKLRNWVVTAPEPKASYSVFTPTQTTSYISSIHTRTHSPGGVQGSPTCGPRRLPDWDTSQVPTPLSLSDPLVVPAVSPNSPSPLLQLKQSRRLTLRLFFTYFAPQHIPSGPFSFLPPWTFR